MVRGRGRAGRGGRGGSGARGGPSRPSSANESHSPLQGNQSQQDSHQSEPIAAMTPAEYKAYYNVQLRFEGAPTPGNRQPPPFMMTPEEYDDYYDYYTVYGHFPEINVPVTQTQGGGRGEDAKEQQPQQNLSLSKIIKEARLLSCTNFSGDTGALESKEWLQFIERTFRDMGLSDDDKLKVVIRLLEKKARTWWENMEVKMRGAVSWDLFLREFDKQYFNNFQKQEARSEFYRLRQGTMSVDDYLSRIIELSAIMPGDTTDEDLCAKFEEGANLYIREQLGGVSRSDLNELHQAAKRAEVNHNLKKQSQERLGKRKDFGASSSQKKSKTGEPSGWNKQQNNTNKGFKSHGKPPRPTVSHSVAGPLKCKNCGRNHFGTCKVPLVCFNCNKPGHIARSCPEPNRTAPSGPSGNRQNPSRNDQGNQNQKTGNPSSAPSIGSNRFQTRLFAMTTEEAEANPDVVAGR